MGPSLCQAVKTLAGSDLQTTLDDWRQQLRTILATDPQGFIGRTSAIDVPDTFPKLAVVEQYIKPVTSRSLGRVFPTVMNAVPDVARIGELCERYFEWGTADEIVARFEENIWPGTILRMILHDVRHVSYLCCSGTLLLLCLLY